MSSYFYFLTDIAQTVCSLSLRNNCISIHHVLGHHKRRLDQQQMWKLVAAFQEYCGIVPPPPQKRPCVQAVDGGEQMEAGDKPAEVDEQLEACGKPLNVGEPLTLTSTDGDIQTQNCIAIAENRIGVSNTTGNWTMDITSVQIDVG